MPYCTPRANSGPLRRVEETSLAAIGAEGVYRAAQYRRLRPGRGHEEALRAVKHPIIRAAMLTLSTWTTHPAAVDLNSQPAI